MFNSEKGTSIKIFTKNLGEQFIEERNRLNWLKMTAKFQHRLSKQHKNEIAQNLIDIIQRVSDIREKREIICSNWILTDAKEKGKLLMFEISFYKKI